MFTCARNEPSYSSTKQLAYCKTSSCLIYYTYCLIGLLVRVHEQTSQAWRHSRKPKACLYAAVFLLITTSNSLCLATLASTFTCTQEHTIVLRHQLTTEQFLTHQYSIHGRTYKVADPSRKQVCLECDLGCMHMCFACNRQPCIAFLLPFSDLLASAPKQSECISCRC